MGALATYERSVIEEAHQAAGWPPERSAKCRQQARNTRSARVRGDRSSQSSWNVLAEQIVPFPSSGTHSARGSSSSAALGYDANLRASGTRVVPSPTRPAPRLDPARVGRPDPSLARPTPALARQAVPGSAGHVAPSRSPRAAQRSRGLRRLLPGAATLAVLASVWFAAGAMSELHHNALVIPAAAVKAQGGYVYVARPGDTLWSIASKLEPGGDPRILVAGFEQQLRGAELVAGDKLKLP